LNLLGIDFEDWYHPEFVQKYISGKKCHPEVINGIDMILELLRKNDTHATFFMVGDLLEFKPELFDDILENGHEIAFHTMKHTRLDSENFKEIFENEIKKFDNLTHGKSKGFRAPSFSLNEKSSWLIDVLEKNNYVYDSSVVPAKTNLYGIPNAEKNPYKISSNSLEKNSSDGKIIEFPIMVTKLLGKTIPTGGGFYLRTLPFKIIKNSFQQYEKQKNPGVFYIHSWELAPKYMPKIKMSHKDNFATYHNLSKAYGKMNELLKLYEFTSFERYLKN